MHHPRPQAPPPSAALVAAARFDALRMALLRPDLLEAALRDASAPASCAHALAAAVDAAAARADAATTARGAEPALGAAAATAALAAAADRAAPSAILALVDRVLSRSGGDALWVLGLLSNSLGVLAAMQSPPEATVAAMSALLRKAARRNVSASALAVKLFRSELLAPLLATAAPLDVAATRTPAWRVHLRSVVALNAAHGAETVLRYADAAAAKRAAHLWALPPSSCCTPLRRVARVVEAVLHWWRQPHAQRVLSCGPPPALPRWRALWRGGGQPAGQPGVAQVSQGSRGYILGN